MYHAYVGVLALIIVLIYYSYLMVIFIRFTQIYHYGNNNVWQEYVKV